MICRRVQELTSFIVMDVLERAQEMERAGESVIHLEVGEPDFDTPEAIKEAAIEALRRGETHYTHSLGIRQLREAICKYYSETYDVRWLEPDQILVTSGTSPAFLIGMGAILECHEEVILSDPHYACHPNFIRFLEAIPKMIPVYEEDGFQYRPEAIRAALTPKTKAILINSPANPTGNLLEPERMAEIADMGRWVLSDEIYHGLVYEGRARSILEFTDRCYRFQRVFQAVCHDRLAPGLSDRTERTGARYAKDAAEFLYLCQCHGTNCRLRGPDRPHGQGGCSEDV